MVQKTMKVIDMFLVKFDNFSKFGWTVRLKSNNGHTIKISIENILISSQRSHKLLEGDRDRGLYISIFQSFFNNNNINFYSRKKPQELFSQKGLILLLEIYLENQFLKEVKAI